MDANAELASPLTPILGEEDEFPQSWGLGGVLFPQSWGLGGEQFPQTWGTEGEVFGKGNQECVRQYLDRF